MLQCDLWDPIVNELISGIKLKLCLWCCVMCEQRLGTDQNISTSLLILYMTTQGQQDLGDKSVRKTARGRHLAVEEIWRSNLVFIR